MMKPHQQTLELKDKGVNKEPSDTFSSMNNVASVLYNQGKYDDAEEVNQQKLQ